MEEPHTPHLYRIENTYNQRRAVHEFMDLLRQEGLTQLSHEQVDWHFDYLHNIDRAQAAAEEAALQQYRQWRAVNPLPSWQGIASLLKRAGFKQTSRDDWWAYGFRIDGATQYDPYVRVHFLDSRMADEKARKPFDVPTAVQQAGEALREAGYIVEENHRTLQVRKPEVAVEVIE